MSVYRTLKLRGLNPTQTIADALGRAGYATAMFGKWHLGDEGRYYPSQRGEADQGRKIP